MRLTKVMREEIISGIRRNIPTINYKEQITKIIEADAILGLPAPIQTLLKKHPDLKCYLATRYIYGYNTAVFNKEYEMGEVVKKGADVLHDKLSNQNKSINQVIHKISACLDECTTTQKFVAFFPEFEKYIPQEDVIISNLPGNTIAAELAALGFTGNTP